MALVRPRHHDLIRRRDLLIGGFAAACSRAAPAGPSWTPAPRTLPAEFARGMNLAHLHRRGYGYGSARSRKQAERLWEIGIRDVAVNPFAYVSSLQSSEIRWGGDPTLTDDDLRAEIAQLRSVGHRVMMKPHLWSGSMWWGAGNNEIRVGDWAAWFASYTKYAVHHARIAAETGCDCLCVGLEYTEATRANPGRWAEVAAACRSVFSGKLLYAANWFEEWSIFTDWDAFDCVGIDAYFPLAGTTIEELEASWDAHLDTIERIGRPVVFPEAGYRAVAGSLEKPWEQGGGTPDPDAQARGYEALLRAVSRRPWFRGVWWWKWFTDLPGEGDPFVPAGNAAEDVLRAWFSP